MTRYDTSIPGVKTKWFNLIRSGEKTIEIRKRRQAQPGQIAQLIKGYNPNYGTVLRKVTRVRRAKPPHVTDAELEKACVEREWLEDYADGGFVYLFFLEADQSG